MKTRLTTSSCHSFVAFAVLLTGVSTASAQVDDFQSGDRMGWGVDAQVANEALSIEADGGPLGAGDRYLLYTSVGGGGPVSRMVLPNTNPGSSWVGDLTGVPGLDFDVLNPGAAPLSLRLAIGNGDTWYASTDASVVGAGADWSTLSFALDDTSQTLLTGSDSFEDVVANVTELRLLSSEALPTISFGGTGSPQGDVMAASIGIDNVRASIPEPGAVVVTVIGSLGVVLRRRV